MVAGGTRRRRLNLNCDVVWFDRLKCKVRLRETGRGHYAIPLFESVHAVPAADCFNSEGAWKRKRDIKHDYNIDQLEQSSHGVEVSTADLVQEAPTSTDQEN